MEVLDAIARALRLTDAEHAHLMHLAQPRENKKKPSSRPQPVRGALWRLLDSMDGVPAYVVGRRADILAWNRMALALFGELSVKSADFRRLWARHDVKERSHGVKRLSHPLVGELTLSFEVFKIPDDQELSLYLYDAELGSRSAEALHLLANWGTDAIRAGLRPATPASGDSLSACEPEC